MLAARRTLRAAGSASARTQRRGMATTQQLKMRITSVTNIQKITKAMKMVAAAKLRAVEAQLGIVREFQKDMSEVWPERDEATVNAQELWPGMEPLAPPEKVLLVPMCSDRGLCGGINSGVLRIVRGMAAQHKEAGREVKMLTIGEKAKAGLERSYKGDFTAVITESGKQKAATFAEVSLLAEMVLDNDFDTASIVYNEFKSAIAYEPKVAVVNKLERAKFDREIWKNWEFEGFQNEDEVFEALHEFRLAVRIQHMATENATSEMSARMSAMENSTKNAGEMLDKLQLLYNRQRQSKITTELIELISGAAAAEEQQKKEAD